MTFYAYKTDSDSSIPGMIYRELQLASFGTKADRDAFLETYPTSYSVKSRSIPAKHMHIYRQFGAPIRGGLFCSVVDSGTNSI